MGDLSRRAHLRQLGAGFAGLGSAALAGWPRPLLAGEEEIPPEGIGKGIRHISYSDIGGRPDSVQVMFGKQHINVGHMFSDGGWRHRSREPRRGQGGGERQQTCRRRQQSSYQARQFRLPPTLQAPPAVRPWSNYSI
jgi:hypothetical protein